ncbi:unnamed protein product [Vitrella brassicaformis CCMP3155]|uniref:Retrotransposon gag domain-containing protein n=1 Tax=Vitrella brassicaformis (strain CCMP3155) TaxID=1169540 RepID=A0A0G4FSE4_VITBC|nr:unnamed protein product [Vitrella brassicaformis CCMP3155]|eukprot:CEM17610.1 unnamed protein product [Vitrella brassicaformis CCMP3155]
MQNASSAQQNHPHNAPNEDRQPPLRILQRTSAEAKGSGDQHVPFTAVQHFEAPPNVAASSQQVHHTNQRTRAAAAYATAGGSGDPDWPHRNPGDRDSGRGNNGGRGPDGGGNSGGRREGAGGEGRRGGDRDRDRRDDRRRDERSRDGHLSPVLQDVFEREDDDLGREWEDMVARERANRAHEERLRREEEREQRRRAMKELKPSPFSGDDGMPAKEWLRELEMWFDEAAVVIQMRPQMFHKQLKPGSSAAAWWYNLPEVTPGSWNELREAFIEQYVPRAISDLIYRQDLKRMRMEDNETIDAFTKRFNIQCTKVNGLTDDEKRTNYLSALARPVYNAMKPLLIGKNDQEMKKVNYAYLCMLAREAAPEKYRKSDTSDTADRDKRPNKSSNRRGDKPPRPLFAATSTDNALASLMAVTTPALLASLQQPATIAAKQDDSEDEDQREEYEEEEEDDDDEADELTTGKTSIGSTTADQLTAAQAVAALQLNALSNPMLALANPLAALANPFAAPLAAPLAALFNKPQGLSDTRLDELCRQNPKAKDNLKKFPCEHCGHPSHSMMTCIKLKKLLVEACDDPSRRQSGPQRGGAPDKPTKSPPPRKPPEENEKPSRP